MIEGYCERERVSTEGPRLREINTKFDGTAREIIRSELKGERVI